jgi:glutathione S-transferase
MRLYYSPTSPYVRKVRAVAIEKGLAGTIELVQVNPLDTAGDLPRHNPLGKIPALVLANGQVIFDSPVICAYLDEIGSGAKLIPDERNARFEALTTEALGDGIMDAAFALVMERRRPATGRSPVWSDRWRCAIARAIATVDVGSLRDHQVTIGHLALASALAYVDFRLPDIEWPVGSVQLREWLDALERRPSLASTRFGGPA